MRLFAPRQARMDVCAPPLSGRLCVWRPALRKVREVNKTKFINSADATNHAVDGDPGAAANTMPHLVYLSYHKTGYELSEVLRKATKSGMHLGMGVSSPTRNCLCKQLDCGEKSTVVRWHAPELVPRQSPVPPCYVIVHMVRDPARWTLSFYDYHRQTPGPEKWIEEKPPKCALAQREHAAMVGLEGTLLAETLSACGRLIAQSGERSSLATHLHQLPELDGLRLMAFMNTLGSSPTGDLLRSAANAIALRRKTSGGGDRSSDGGYRRPQVLTFWMDTMVSEPEAAFAELGDFVVRHMADSASTISAARLDSDTTRLAAALRQAEDDAFAAKVALADECRRGGLSAYRCSHVTSTKRDDASKAQLLAALQADPQISRIFALWRSVFSPPPSLPSSPPSPPSSPPAAPSVPPPSPAPSMSPSPPPRASPPPSVLPSSSRSPSPAPPPSPTPPSPPPHPPSSSPVAALSTVSTVDVAAVDVASSSPVTLPHPPPPQQPLPPPPQPPSTRSVTLPHQRLPRPPAALSPPLPSSLQAHQAPSPRNSSSSLSASSMPATTEGGSDRPPVPRVPLVMLLATLSLGAMCLLWACMLCDWMRTRRRLAPTASSQRAAWRAPVHRHRRQPKLWTRSCGPQRFEATSTLG